MCLRVSAVQAFKAFIEHRRRLLITISQAMLINMKSTIINSVLTVLLVLAMSSTHPISVVDALKIKPKPVAEKEDTEEKETKYTRFSISSPKNDQTIWNESQLVVTTKLTPALNTTLGHTTWLIMDGKALIKKSQSTSLLIGRADRGTHTIQVQIRDKKGKILKRTKSITVYIKNTVVPRPSPR